MIQHYQTHVLHPVQGDMGKKTLFPLLALIVVSWTIIKTMIQHKQAQFLHPVQGILGCPLPRGLSLPRGPSLFPETRGEEPFPWPHTEQGRQSGIDSAF